MIPITIPYFDDRESSAVKGVIESGWVTQGPQVESFEKAFSEYIGVEHSIAMTSCTTALFASLVVSGIEPGDEIIVPSLSFIATANAIMHTGAYPVFVDVDPKTLNVDPGKIEQAVTKRTKAILPVHQLGLPADMDAIDGIARKLGIRVIEDAACAIGSAHKEKRIGNSDNLVAFSFHPRKLITTGEGGMITTNDAEVAKKLRRFRHHGMSISDLERHSAQTLVFEQYNEIGYNFRLTDIQAAIGIEQMKKLDYIIDKRNEIAHRYDSAFADIPFISTPSIPSYVTHHNYQTYWIEIKANSPVSRNAFMEAMNKKEIATRRGVMAAHREMCYASSPRWSNVALPNTDRITENTAVIPLFPTMTDAQVGYVIQSVKDIFFKEPV
jgi:dTDP-4-amino-4,6-dideoxygalactose transaminase